MSVVGRSTTISIDSDEDARVNVGHALGSQKQPLGALFEVLPARVGDPVHLRTLTSLFHTNVPLVNQSLKAFIHRLSLEWKFVSDLARSQHRIICRYKPPKYVPIRYFRRSTSHTGHANRGHLSYQKWLISTLGNNILEINISGSTIRQAPNAEANDCHRASKLNLIGNWAGVRPPTRCGRFRPMKADQNDRASTNEAYDLKGTDTRPDGGTPTDDLFRALANPRRRRALEAVANCDEAIGLHELAEEIATDEDDDACARLVALYHCHLVMLADAGLVAVNWDRHKIVPTNRTSEAVAMIAHVRDAMEGDR